MSSNAHVYFNLPLHQPYSTGGIQKTERLNASRAIRRWLAGTVTADDSLICYAIESTLNL